MKVSLKLFSAYLIKYIFGHENEEKTYTKQRNKIIFKILISIQYITLPIEISTEIFTSINHKLSVYTARPHKHTSKCFVIHHIIFKFIEYIDHHSKHRNFQWYKTGFDPYDDDNPSIHACIHKPLIISPTRRPKWNKQGRRTVGDRSIGGTKSSILYFTYTYLFWINLITLKCTYIKNLSKLTKCDFSIRSIMVRPEHLFSYLVFSRIKLFVFLEI